jgi:hypothetical protein
LDIGCSGSVILNFGILLLPGRHIFYLSSSPLIFNESRFSLRILLSLAISPRQF